MCQELEKYLQKNIDDALKSNDFKEDLSLIESNVLSCSKLLIDSFDEGYKFSICINEIILIVDLIKRNNNTVY